MLSFLGIVIDLALEIHRGAMPLFFFDGRGLKFESQRAHSHYLHCHSYRAHNAPNVTERKLFLLEEPLVSYLRKEHG
jgi:hypothetical protein